MNEDSFMTPIERQKKALEWFVNHSYGDTNLDRCLAYREAIEALNAVTKGTANVDAITAIAVSKAKESRKFLESRGRSVLCYEIGHFDTWATASGLVVDYKTKDEETAFHYFNHPEEQFMSRMVEDKYGRISHDRYDRFTGEWGVI
jgi:hypothetical protein